MPPLSVVTVGITSFGVAVSALAIALPALYPTPTPLPDRLAPIDEDAVTIDNDEIYTTMDWWHECHPLSMANAARVPFFHSSIEQHFAVAENGDVQRQRTILDVGCGGGLVAEEVARRQRRAKVIGVDVSVASIDKAKAHSPFKPDRLTYVVGSAYALPFDDASVDAVICSDVLEHLHDVPRALSEINRVLRPQGLFVYDTINRSTLSWWLTIVVAQKWLGYVPGHAHDWRLYITPDEMRQAASKAGLRHASVEHTKGMRPTLAFPWTIIQRLVRGRAGTWSLLDAWILTSDTHVSYLSTCTKV